MEMAVVCGEMQSGHPSAAAERRIDAVIEQDRDDVVAAVRAGPDESFPEFVVRCRREQLLHAIEIADTGSVFEIEIRAAAGEKSSREWTSVRQTRAHRLSRYTFDDRAAFEQQPDQLDLHAGSLGMNARGGEAERRRMTGVRVRLGVHVRTAIEQQARNFDDIRRRALAKVFDAVRRDVVKQRRLMLAARSLPDQLRRLIEQPSKRVDVAGDDRIRRLLELRLRGAVLQRVNVPRELRPTRKPMRTSNQKLRV